ncbi:MAG: DUF4129 domain-containing protein [Planctomycetaceae bacterium]|nr:DUF4129 domain-containing protein [Planctomycetales bacterium]MCB9923915.1 DUF4129 domain-containing protein [Planctomycetaceae bacterium]
MKPRPTLADYVIIAISPALIMALIGSLVFFLIELFYQGQYQTRLQYVFALFVFAAVLIGRISIEEGRERAMAFSAILSVAVLLVLTKFIEFSGIFARLSLIINAGLIALILWCANKLTWDCTVIDEQQDASGEGLLQTTGMDSSPSTDSKETTVPDGTTGDLPAEEPKLTLLQRIAGRNKKKHAPGVWVVYFSMAALPIFGVGQGFIFHQSDDSRRFVFKLLVVYVAAALGLLLTTSFLGLRRYLRQRQLEMPTQMAGAWMGTGAVMIVGLLLFCMILPRRNAEYSITDLPAFAGSPDDLLSNPWGFGNDGPETDNASRQVKRENAEKESGQAGDDKGSGREKSKNGKGQSQADKSGRKGETESDSSKSDGQDEGNPSDEDGRQKVQQKDGSDQQESQQQSDSQQDRQGDKSGTERQENSSKQSNKQQEPQQDRSAEQNSEPSESQQNTSGQNDNGDTQKSSDQQKSDQSEKKEQSSEEQQQPSEPKFDPAKLAKQLGGSAGMLLKLLYWVIVILIVGWFLWKYWSQVREAVRNFIQAVRGFWAKLFGGSMDSAAEGAVDEAINSSPPPPPFSAFANPFESGLAARLPLDQLIKYSFEAFEAWARERGYTRRVDETPHEFAQQVAQSGTGVSQEAIHLAELYSRAAYSGEAMPQTSSRLLQQLWHQLSQRGHHAPP